MPTWRRLNNNMSICWLFPGCPFGLWMWVVSPSISRNVLKPHLRRRMRCWWYTRDSSSLAIKIISEFWTQDSLWNAHTMVTHSLSTLGPSTTFIFSRNSFTGSFFFPGYRSTISCTFVLLSKCAYIFNLSVSQPHPLDRNSTQTTGL
jgi:hypothetical protein